MSAKTAKPTKMAKDFDVDDLSMLFSKALSNKKFVNPRTSGRITKGKAPTRLASEMKTVKKTNPVVDRIKTLKSTFRNPYKPVEEREKAGLELIELQNEAVHKAEEKHQEELRKLEELNASVQALRLPKTEEDAKKESTPKSVEMDMAGGKKRRSKKEKVSKA